MEIRTFTSFWNLERKFYSLGDIHLPTPISLRVAGVFVLTAVPWWLLMALFQVPLSSPGYLLWIAPPGLFAYFGSKPIFEGKTIFQYLASIIRFFLENRNYKNGLLPDLNKYGESIDLDTQVLVGPRPAEAKTLPLAGGR